MVDFSYHAPTEVVFGKNSELHTADLVKKYGGTRLLLHYGGNSAERSGLLDVVRGQLRQAGIAFVELGGVVPNPLLSKVYEGIDLCRSEGVDFILAVGGGSVIDSARPSVSDCLTMVTFGISSRARARRRWLRRWAAC